MHARTDVSGFFLRTDTGVILFGDVITKNYNFLKKCSEGIKEMK